MPATIYGNGGEGGRIGGSSQGSSEGEQERNSSSSPDGLVDCDWCGAVTRILWGPRARSMFSVRPEYHAVLRGVSPGMSQVRGGGAFVSWVRPTSFNDGGIRWQAWRYS
jgi:hypothetical protein